MRKKISNFALGLFGLTVDAKIAAAKKLSKKSTDALIYAVASINKSIDSKKKEIVLIEDSITDDYVKRGDLQQFVSEAAKPLEINI